MRILLTGAGGVVGARMLSLLRERGHEPVCFPRGMLAAATQAQVEAFALRAEPEAVIHLAAISDTAYCEAHPDESRRANVDVTLWLCEAARKAGARMVCYSSDQVYNGLGPGGPYPEDAVRVPNNVYGRHKLESEQRALALLPSAVMLRATWMFDLPGYHLPTHDNFLLRVIRAAVRSEPIAFSHTDWRGLSYVREAAEHTLDALALPGGVYNFGSDCDLPMDDAARDVLCALGAAHRADEPIRTRTDLPARSLRMDSAKLQGHGIGFDPTAVAIRCCLQG